MKKFQQNFFWGTATSAHQIEGDNFNNDWWEAEQKGLVPYKSGKACDLYNRYEEDFALAKAMHNNAHRFSIEWSRVEPDEGKFSDEAIEHYRKVLQALWARGLEPFVTLHHFTNPIWFANMGGWANKKAPEYFARYAQKIIDTLGDLVTHWISINEPTILFRMGYILGVWPPFHKNNFFTFFRCLNNMAEAHKRAYVILHELLSNSPLKVGIAHSVNYFEPAGGLLQLINSFSTAAARYLKNEWFLNKIKDYQDFIGLNYYNHFKISLLRGRFQGNGERSDFGWEIYPEGIYHVVKKIYQRYKKPIFITENGISDADDDQRPEFIKNHLIWLYKSIQEGADVRGYFHWSLLDNYEWTEGFSQKFGLVELDFNTFARKIRPSGELYGKICQNNGFDV